jgi:hypothetical protein
MGNDAPDARAQALADKILGKAPSQGDVEAALMGRVSVGKRDEDGRPTGKKVSLEEYLDGSKPKRGARAQQEDDTDPDEGDGGGDGDLDDDLEEEADDEEGSELDADDEDADEEPDDDDEEDDDEDDGEDTEEVAYSDDDELDVAVDGETKAVSLRELKRVYSLQGATEKRLKEATDLRTAAQAERETAASELQGQRTNMLRTIQQLDGVLFAPLVSEPDPKLRTKNMQEYLLQKDAWEEDQKRIKAGREELATFMADENGKLAENRQKFREAQQALLVEKLPELRDPQMAPKVQSDIMMAAAHYGFTPQMVASVDHHGLFLMARDAARWLNMQKIKKNGKLPHGRDGEATVLKRKRHLKPGGATSRKLSLVKTQKEQQAATKKAQSTGRVDDVANMLISKARTVRRNK